MFVDSTPAASWGESKGRWSNGQHWLVDFLSEPVHVLILSLVVSNGIRSLIFIMTRIEFEQLLLTRARVICCSEASIVNISSTEVLI